MRRARHKLLFGLCLLFSLGLFMRALAEPGPQAPSTFAGMGVPISDIVRALGQANAQRLKPVGTSSVVFRMELEGEIEAAFKPRTRRHPEGHLAEVSAFRIARALGMDNVAPAAPRRMSVNRMRVLLEPAFQGQWEALAADMLVDPDQGVDGVAIYWIPEMKELGIDTREGMGHWRRWLSQEAGDPPSREKSKLVAAQVSTMIAFDYLIGNWDRFSGANAQGDPSERHLFVRDHNVAFMQPLPGPQHARVLARLREVERFSRAFVVRVQALDADALAKALRDPSDPEGYAALTESQIAGVLDRRRTLLSYIAALLDRHGEANVLTFP